MPDTGYRLPQVSSNKHRDSGILMKHRKHNPTWEHIKLLVWVILIIEVLILCMALAAGRITGYQYSFKICFWLGLLVAVVFLSILALNLVSIATWSSVTRLRGRLSNKWRRPG